MTRYRKRLDTPLACCASKRQHALHLSNDAGVVPTNQGNQHLHCLLYLTYLKTVK